LEHCLQPLLVQLSAVSRIAKIVRDKVEALRLRRAMTGEVDDDDIFGLGTFD